eukprot:8512256-Alexandrium_andersonii.AAC.1
MHVGARRAGTEALRACLRFTDSDDLAPAGQASCRGVPVRRGEPSVEPEGAPMPAQDVERPVPLPLIRLQQ